MALRDWVKTDILESATATPAAPATHRPINKPTVAIVATVAVASPRNRKMNLERVAYYDTEIDAVIKEFDAAGVTVHTATSKIRQRAREIMAEFESAAFMDDRELFKAKLKEWRDTWLSRCH
jgi:hypothetical protein